MKILVLNAGSSSHKSCLFDLGQGAEGAAPHPLWRATLDWTHQQGKVELSASGAGESIQQVLAITDKAAGLEAMVNTLVEGPTQVLDRLSAIDAVGHRVVHGGRDYIDSVPIDEAVKAAIRRLIPLAPAHNPATLRALRRWKIFWRPAPGSGVRHCLSRPYA
jgi:acetate kinase